MLPFLEPKKITSIIIARRGKSNLQATPEVNAPGQDSHPLMEAAEDIMRAFEHKSVTDLAHALQATYEICESQPEQEPETDEAAGS